jgi:hypothetical protein
VRAHTDAPPAVCCVPCLHGVPAAAGGKACSGAAQRCVIGDAVRFLPVLDWCKRRQLQNNQLTGAIPDSLGSLSSLGYLYAPMRLLLACARALDGMPRAASCLLATVAGSCTVRLVTPLSAGSCTDTL